MEHIEIIEVIVEQAPPACEICCDQGRQLNICCACKRKVCNPCAIDKNRQKLCVDCSVASSMVHHVDDPTLADKHYNPHSLDPTKDPKKPKTICIDFDGVISDYSGGWQGEGCYGPPIPGIQKATHWLKCNGWHIIIFTCRDEKEDIAEFCKANDICFDEINEQNHSEHNNSPKPHADVYVDDRAINFNGDWGATIEQIEDFKPWYHEGAKPIVVVGQKTLRVDVCTYACDKCGEPINESKAVRYGGECFHKECLLGEDANKVIAQLESLHTRLECFTHSWDERCEIEREIVQIEQKAMRHFHPLFRQSAAEDNFNEANIDRTKLEDEDDQRNMKEPVEKRKKSTTHNYVKRDKADLIQDRPDGFTYPKEDNVINRPRHINPS